MFSEVRGNLKINRVILVTVPEFDPVIEPPLSDLYKQRLRFEFKARKVLLEIIVFHSNARLLIRCVNDYRGIDRRTVSTPVRRRNYFLGRALSFAVNF